MQFSNNLKKSNMRMYLKFISLIIVSFTFIIVSCIRTVDISGVYKGEIIPEELNEMKKAEVEIILNQTGKNLSGGFIVGQSAALQIQSGIVEGNNISFFADLKVSEQYLSELNSQIKFDGKIKRRILNGNVRITTIGYKIDRQTGETIQLSDDIRGILIAERQ